MLQDIGNMKQIKETLDQAKMITSFIHNNLKVVNLMKVFTKDRDLLCPDFPLNLFHFSVLYVMRVI